MYKMEFSKREPNDDSSFYTNDSIIFQMDDLKNYKSNDELDDYESHFADDEADTYFAPITTPRCSRPNTPQLGIKPEMSFRIGGLAIDLASPIDRVPSFILETPEEEDKTCNGAFNRLVNNMFENPGGHLTNSQRLFILLYTLFETYRTIISSFLIVFVPQSCNGVPCSLYENVIPKTDLETITISLNTLMAVYFCGLFLIENMREKTINRHLKIDRSAPNDKDSLILMVRQMNPESRDQIFRINNFYRIYAQGLVFISIVNMCVSSFVIYANYLNNNTATVFITNALFMINRIYRALRVTSSGEYNIYSAYRSDSLIYNLDREAWPHIPSPIRRDVEIQRNSDIEAFHDVSLKN